MEINQDKIAGLLKEGWGLTLFESKKVRSAYKVRTNEGVLALKKSREKADKLLFIKEAQDYLQKNGFQKMSPLLSSLKGTPFHLSNKELYVLSPWIEGLEPSYRNLQHIQMAAYTLADMHQRSKGFRARHAISDERYGKWPKKIAKRERELRLYIDLAKHAQDDFDKLFLAHADWLLERTKETLTRLYSPAYLKVAEEAKRGYICHGDTAVRNCVIKDNEIIFIDFDSMAEDLPITDLWRLLRRSLRRNKWSPDFVTAVLAAYEANRKLSPEEKYILMAFLIFPEKAWRIAHRYYEKKGRKDWSKEGYCEDLEEFLKDRREMDNFAALGLGGE